MKQETVNYLLLMLVSGIAGAQNRKGWRGWFGLIYDLGSLCFALLAFLSIWF